MEPVALILIGLALLVGGAAGFSLATSRAATARTESAARGAFLRTELTSAHNERTTAEQSFATRLTDVELAAKQRADEMERRHTRAMAEAEERHATSLERLEQAHEAERARLMAEAEKRVTELRADTKRLADEFDSLAQKALAQNNKAFLAQAEERLKRSQSEQAAELTKREEAVKSIVAPLEKTLSQVKEEMTTAEKSRLQAHAALSQQVQGMKESSELLRTETSALVTALRKPQARGQWGEMQLRRTVEFAGMVEHVDFDEQVQLDGGAARPDMVVTLPGGKKMVVDAKVAFSGYLEAQEARDEATRADRLAAHAKHLRTHIDQLSAKEYWSRLEASPEFTVMFIPAEVFLDEALKQDPSLQEHAFSKNIILATPNTLVPLLKTVGLMWRQEQLAAEAKQVFNVGRVLHQRLTTFGSHLDAVAKKLNSTVDAFNKMSRSLDTRLVPQLNQFSNLQLLDEVALPQQIELRATPPQKPELYAAQVEAGPSDANDGSGADVTSDAGDTTTPNAPDAPPTPGPDTARAERDAVLQAMEDSEHDNLLAELVREPAGSKDARKRA